MAPDLRLWTGATPQLCHSGQELGVVSDGRVGDFEATVARSKRDCDRSWCTVLPDNFLTSHNGIEGRKALLAVDDQGCRTEAGSLRSKSAGFLVTRRVPKHECPNRKTKKYRVEEITHLCIFPNEGALQVRQRDHFTLDVAHQRGNRALTVFENRRPAAYPGLPRSAEFVLVRGISELRGILRLGAWLRLRQLATDDAANVSNRFGDMIFKANRTSHARHGHVNEADEPVLKQSASFSRMVDGERKEKPSRKALELPVFLGVRSESAADIITDRQEERRG